ncbi:hypothetical protein AB0M22_35525 [Nocardia sp. NPDC051756]|uniref:hypothetical protein n=1 Tax=Nocardia sp. NPDC051756 TaxID=3154751 RepID=UPI0034389C05
MVDFVDQLKGLSEQEKAACLIAERVLGAVAEPWDIAGRSGVVDAMLTLADGRRAAFEVTVLAAEGAIQTDSLLRRDNHSWPLPGKWLWSIRIGAPSDIPRLRAAYQRIALACEAAGVQRPQNLPWDVQIADPDIRWLVQESASEMTGISSVPAVDGGHTRSAMLGPPARAGIVDRSLAGLRPALETAFAQHHMPRHLEKLRRAEADERHLFIPMHLSALPFSVIDGLMASESLPPDAPPLPQEVTHLWLAPAFSRRVLLWNGAEWSSHDPYDN